MNLFSPHPPPSATSNLRGNSPGTHVGESYSSKLESTAVMVDNARNVHNTEPSNLVGLPQEILFAIFQHIYIRPDPARNGSEPNQKTLLEQYMQPVRLSHISSALRSAALSMAMLWTRTAADSFARGARAIPVWPCTEQPTRHGRRLQHKRQSRENLSIQIMEATRESLRRENMALFLDTSWRPRSGSR